MGVRDCPAAVSGNDRRQTHWVRPGPGKRRPVGIDRSDEPVCPRVRRPASAPRPSGAVVRGLVGRPTAGTTRPLLLVVRPSPPARPRTVPGPISRGERHDGHGTRRTGRDAGAQEERRRRARRRQQDRAGRRPGLRRPGRRRPDAGRHPHHQRPVRRGQHRRAGPAVDPDGRRDDRRGAAVLAARRAPPGRLHRQGGPQPGRHVVQPVDRARSRRGADRRGDRAVRQGQRPQARLRHRPGRRPAVRVLRAAHRLRPLPAAAPLQPAGRRDAAVLPPPGRLRPGQRRRPRRSSSTG